MYILNSFYLFILLYDSLSVQLQLEIQKLIASVIISIIVSGILPGVEARRLVRWTSHCNIRPQLSYDHLIPLVLLSQPHDLCLKYLDLLNQINILIPSQLLELLLHCLINGVVLFYLVAKLFIHPFYLRLFEGEFLSQFHDRPRSIA